MTSLFCPGFAEAIARERGPARGLVLRALPRLEKGVYSEAEEDLREALSLGSSATAAALLGLTCLLTGRGSEARLWLDRAARREPRRAWPYLLRALCFRRCRRLESACRDLARAARLEPSAWTLALRSEILGEMDEGPEALRDLDRALRLSGPRPDLLSRRARLLAGSGLWARALKDFNLTLRLAPDSRLYFERAQARLRLGRSRQAEQDLSRALRIKPEHEPARFSRLRLRLGRGALREARGDLRWLLAKASEDNRLEAAFYQGFLELRSGRPKAAEESFRRLSESEAASQELRRRADFYRILCRASSRDFQLRHPASSHGARLVIAGLGMLPPYTASLETCQALRNCDVVFDNVTTEEAREFLSALGPEVRPLRYDGLPQEARTALYRRTIFREILKGRVAGFATRGHAMVAGVFAKALVRHCRRLGISYRILGAVSCLDLMSSQEATPGQSGGLQAYVFDDLERLEKIETSLPLLLFPWGNMRNGLLRLQRSLERFYPPGHPCRVYGSRYDISPVQVPLSRLASSFPRLGTMRDLHLPPLKANGGDCSPPPRWRECQWHSRGRSDRTLMATAPGARRAEHVLRGPSAAGARPLPWGRGRAVGRGS